MIRRLRWKLTLFNTAITGAILLAVTLLSVYVSERDIRERTEQTFSDTFSTVSAYLTSQERIPVEWLRQVENTGNVCISIRDGGTPLFSMGLSREREGYEAEFQQIRDLARQEHGLDAGDPQWGGSCVLSLEGADGQAYWGGLALIPKNGTALELTMLYALEPMEQSIRRQRLVVFLGELLAMGLLVAFSWCFTGKMLRPIQENQQRQAQFTAAASHELRTPLASILSAASAMEGREPEQQAKFSQIIRREGRRMNRLVEDLLTLASADSQSWEIQPESVEPDMLLLEAYETHLSRAREKGLTLKLELPEEAGPEVRADKDRIGQVLSVLLDNALAYTPAPGCVRLGLTYGRGVVRLSVEDTGPGVPDREKKQIFERFYRSADARRERGHFGLGLSIASRIVKLHRGKLWVEDGEEGGAVFVLELPLR